jgi:hypothetical protein
MCFTKVITNLANKYSRVRNCSRRWCVSRIAALWIFWRCLLSCLQISKFCVASLAPRHLLTLCCYSCHPSHMPVRCNVRANSILPIYRFHVFILFNYSNVWGTTISFMYVIVLSSDVITGVLCSISSPMYRCSVAHFERVIFCNTFRCIFMGLQLLKCF